MHGGDKRVRSFKDLSSIRGARMITRFKDFVVPRGKHSRWPYSP
jgi:hypothetical protein